MKAVSGKTWVQKAVFLEPKPLFSSALTMWSRGWYLCMELSIICRGEGSTLLSGHISCCFWWKPQFGHIVGSKELQSFVYMWLIGLKTFVFIKNKKMILYFLHLSNCFEFICNRLLNQRWIQSELFLTALTPLEVFNEISLCVRTHRSKPDHGADDLSDVSAGDTHELTARVNCTS